MQTLLYFFADNAMHARRELSASDQNVRQDFKNISETAAALSLGLQEDELQSAASAEDVFSHSWVLGKGHIPLELPSLQLSCSVLSLHIKMDSLPWRCMERQEPLFVFSLLVFGKQASWKK